VSVGSDDISRETLRIARHGLAARISRVVPFSLRGFLKKTLSKFAGREVTGSLALLAAGDPRSSDTCECSRIVFRRVVRTLAGRSQSGLVVFGPVNVR
jgi:hypothetical protein